MDKLSKGVRHPFQIHKQIHKQQVLLANPAKTIGQVDVARRRKALRVSNSEGPLEDFAKGAQKAGTAAWTKLNEAYVIVDDQVKRTASQVNNKYDVSGKAQHAANQVSEQARSVDSRYGVNRRLRNLADDLQRKWPIWKSRYTEFSKTLPGQLVFLSAIFFLFWSGIAWRLLNLVFIAWWLSPFLFLLFSKFGGNKANAQARRREQQERQRQQNNYFSAFFNSRRQGSQQQQPSGSNRRKYDGPDEGPVIDVEYTTIDEQ